MLRWNQIPYLEAYNIATMFLEGTCRLSKTDLA